MVGGAENSPGLSKVPKMRILSVIYYRGVVGEHSNCTEAGLVRACGAIRRENVGMSNVFQNEKF